MRIQMRSRSAETERHTAQGLAFWGQRGREVNRRTKGKMEKKDILDYIHKAALCQGQTKKKKFNINASPALW